MIEKIKYSKYNGTPGPFMFMSYLSQHKDISSIAMQNPQHGHFSLFSFSEGLANLTADYKNRTMIKYGMIFS